MKKKGDRNKKGDITGKEKDAEREEEEKRGNELTSRARIDRLVLEVITYLCKRLCEQAR